MNCRYAAPGSPNSYYHLDPGDRWTADGWFRTGDVVTIDSEGYVKITDRVKDLIKSGGEWISSVDLENALVAHESVKEAAVVAVSHPKWQERPLAVVVPKDGCSIGDCELRDFLAQRFARLAVAVCLCLRQRMPQTSTGKRLKSKLRQQFSQWQWEEQPRPTPESKG